MDKNKFLNYYYKFLNYSGNEKLICSLNRDRKINMFEYPIIISKYEGDVLYSISSKWFEDIKTEIYEQNEKDIKKYLNKFFYKRNTDVIIQTMLRMSKNTACDIDVSNVIELSENTKQQYFNSFEHSNNVVYKQEKWEKMKRYKYVNGIIIDDQFVSVGFVSDIIEGGANIVIQTKEKYRDNGYAKRIVEKISRQILEDNLLPIYWVNIENTYSLQLAKSLNFEEKAKEIVVKKL